MPSYDGLLKLAMSKAASGKNPDMSLRKEGSIAPEVIT